MASLVSLAFGAFETAWTRYYYGGSSTDVTDLSVDPNGFVLITGTVTIRYSPTGDTAVSAGGWVRPGGLHVKTDPSSNVFVVSNTGELIKYNPSGNEQWRRPVGGFIAVDQSGYVYTTSKIPSSHGLDVMTVKCSPSGDTTEAGGGWVRRYNNPQWNGNDEPWAIAVGPTGSVYVVLTSPSVFGNSISVIKYSPQGDTARVSGGWVVKRIGPGYAYATPITMKCDMNDNIVILAGEHPRSYSPYDPCTQLTAYLTVRLTSAGVETWNKEYSAGCDRNGWPSDLVLDLSGSAYVTGYAWVNDSTDWDYATVKYDSLGNKKWEYIFRGSLSSVHEKDAANSIDIDRDGYVWVTGWSHRQDSLFYPDDQIASVACHPGTGSQHDALYFNRDWTGRDVGRFIACDTGGNLYVAGTSCLSEPAHPDRCYSPSVTVIKYRTMATSVVQIDPATLPEGFQLNQNHPNPFNATTEIQFEIPRSSFVLMEVRNILGQKVKTLVSEELRFGRYLTTWDGTDDRGNTVSSGIYLYTITTGSYSTSRKMILLK
jgi:hypothetical protein